MLAQEITESQNKNTECLEALKSLKQETLGSLRESSEEFAKLKEQLKSDISQLRCQLSLEEERSEKSLRGVEEKIQSVKSQGESAHAESLQRIEDASSSFLTKTEDFRKELQLLTSNMQTFKEDVVKTNEDLVRKGREEGLAEMNRLMGERTDEFSEKVRELKQELEGTKQIFSSELKDKDDKCDMRLGAVTENLKQIGEKQAHGAEELRGILEELKNQLSECLRASVFESFKNSNEDKVSLLVDSAKEDIYQRINSSLTLEVSKMESHISLSNGKIENFEKNFPELKENLKNSMGRIESLEEETRKKLQTANEEASSKFSEAAEMRSKLSEELVRLRENLENLHEEFTKEKGDKNESITKLQSFISKSEENSQKLKLEVLSAVDDGRSALEAKLEASLEADGSKFKEFEARINMMRIELLSKIEEQGKNLIEHIQSLDSLRLEFGELHQNQQKDLQNLAKEFNQNIQTFQAEYKKNWDEFSRGLNLTTSETIESHVSSLKKQIELTKKESLKALYSSIEQVNEVKIELKSMKGVTEEGLSRVSKEVVANLNQNYMSKDEIFNWIKDSSSLKESSESSLKPLEANRVENHSKVDKIYEQVDNPKTPTENKMFENASNGEKRETENGAAENLDFSAQPSKEEIFEGGKELAEEKEADVLLNALDKYDTRLSELEKFCKSFQEKASFYWENVTVLEAKIKQIVKKISPEAEPNQEEEEYIEEGAVPLEGNLIPGPQTNKQFILTEIVKLLEQIGERLFTADSRINEMTKVVSDARSKLNHAFCLNLVIFFLQSAENNKESLKKDRQQEEVKKL